MPTRTATHKSSPRAKKDTPGPTGQRLTAQQELFVDAITSNNFNQKDAAIRAGCPPTSAASTACKWLDCEKYPQITAAIQRKMEFRRNTAEVDAKRIMQEYARIGFFDPRRILRPDGKGVLDLKDMPDDIAAVISNIHVTYSQEADENGDFHTLKHIRFQFHDKISALNSLAGMLGLNNGGATTIINNNTTNQLILKWDDLYKRAAALPANDPIEAEIAAIEAKALPEAASLDSTNSSADNEGAEIKTKGRLV